MKNTVNTRRVLLLGAVLVGGLPGVLMAQRAQLEDRLEPDGAVEMTETGKRKLISGVVTDERGETIIGATVVVKGEEMTGTTTDMDGKFSLEVPLRSVIVVSYMGFTPQEVRIFKRNLYDITLKEDNKVLDEVVVVGYGSVKKSDLTGSVTAISTARFKDQPVKRVENILQGRSAGVEVTAQSGMPGGGMKVRVRGTTSINTSNDPLYVIDGMISPSGLDGLNPADIQSMEVLKDASSTAIYGSRGSNGVIIITTKQGTQGRAVVSFDASVGISKVRKQYELLNAYEYALALNDVRGANTISAADLEAYRNGTKGLDWMDLITQTALTQDYKLDISGGTEKVRYLVSGNVMDQEAVTIMSDYKRYGLRVNVDADVKPWLTVSGKLNASIIHQHNGAANWLNAINYSPTMELVDPETGVYNKDPYNIANGTSPYGEMMVNYSDSYSYNVSANVSLLFKIAKGLTFSVQGGYDYEQRPSYSFNSSLVGPGAINSMSNSNTLHNYWQNTNNLSWQREFGKHSVSAMAVWEVSRAWDPVMQISGSNLSNETVGYWNVANAAVRNASNSYTESSMASGIVRAGYDFDKRYFLTAAVRGDGSSKFQGKNKWGYFPSAALAWDIAREKFMKNQKVIRQLKLRGSFGVSGNQNIAPFSTLGMLTSTSYGWGTSTAYTGYWGYQFPTPDITWEKTYQYDLGLDLNVAGVNLTFDWFKKKTVDLLFQKQVPRYNGGGTIWVNEGKMNNTGVEMTVSATPVQGALTWETTLNAAYVKNEVLDLAGNDFVLTANYSNLGGPMQIMKPGYPLGSFYVYEWQGFDEKGANLYRKADGSLTTSPTSEDLVIKGQASPKWTFGWNNSLSWNNWSLNVFFNAAVGLDRLNMSRFMTASMTGDSRFVTLREAYFEGWDYVSDKSQAKYPSLKNPDNKYYANSDFWLEDASFVKLKNVSLSYRIPKRVTKFGSVLLSVSAQDVLTLTRYKGMDPEVYSGYDGLDYGAYPVPFTITFGAKINF
ncbi:MAG: TonB-dependent receptor [Bacteroides sp.]|nr:TonB-dependent receptor [Bacteroides sp.]